MPPNDGIAIGTITSEPRPEDVKIGISAKTVVAVVNRQAHRKCNVRLRPPEAHPPSHPHDTPSTQPFPSDQAGHFPRNLTHKRTAPPQRPRNRHLIIKRADHAPSQPAPNSGGARATANSLASLNSPIARSTRSIELNRLHPTALSRCSARLWCKPVPLLLRYDTSPVPNPTLSS